MKKLLIVSASFLFVAGLISMGWAQGPKGSGSSYRSYGHLKPHSSRSSHSRVYKSHGRHYQHKSLKRHNRHYRHKGRNQYFLGHKRNRHQRHYRNYYGPYYYGPYARSYNDSYDEDYKNDLPIEEPPKVPQHSTSNRIYYKDNPEPWFLYGKSKELREMGVIPPLPQASDKKSSVRAD